MDGSLRTTQLVMLAHQLVNPTKKPRQDHLLSVTPIPASVLRSWIRVDGERSISKRLPLPVRFSCDCPLGKGSAEFGDPYVAFVACSTCWETYLSHLRYRAWNEISEHGDEFKSWKPPLLKHSTDKLERNIHQVCHETASDVEKKRKKQNQLSLVILRTKTVRTLAEHYTSHRELNPAGSLAEKPL